jgi:hypothetical protein
MTKTFQLFLNDFIFIFFFAFYKLTERTVICIRADDYIIIAA